MGETPTIFMTAADVSGDVHAARLIGALRDRLGEVRFVGLGGERMAAAGCELLEDPVRRSSMLTGAFGQVFYYIGLIRRTARAMSEAAPAVHVPVDSPALNWHLAAAARRRGVPVAYYIAPQVWAWAPWRVRKLRRLTDAVGCILPFEETYLRRRGVNARYVGHPLFDDLPTPAPLDLSAAASGQWRIALLPGSREAEIIGHAPALAEVSDRLRETFPDAELTFTARDDASADRIRRSTGRDDVPICVGDAAEVFAQSHFAVAASGTVTLEAAWFGVPMVIFYRASRLLHRLLHPLVIRTRRLSLVNILAGEDLVPELMPWSGNVGALAEACLGMLSDPDRLARTRRRLLDLVAPLRVSPPASAAGNAADLIVDTMR